MFRITVMLTALAVVATAASSSSGYAADRMSVFVSIVPQKYFVRQIGGNIVNVQVMVQPGANPENYEPKPRQMGDLLNARAYFAIGVPFEDAWLGKISALNPKMKVVHTESGIEKMPMEDPLFGGEEAHSEGGVKQGTVKAADEDGRHHDHGGLDPHIWLSPPLVKRQALTILGALKELDPAHSSDFEANYRKFIANIDALDTELKATLADMQGRRFMVFHPSWGYFARAYGLRQIPIEIEGKDPKPGQLKTLIEYARQEGIKVIFVQPQFSSKNAELIAGEIAGRVAVADPLSEDWMENLRQVAENIREGMK